MTTKQNDTAVAGHQIQIDRSGQGHAWRDIDAADIPASAREEIEGEIIDGQRNSCAIFVAANGQHYRWWWKQATASGRIAADLARGMDLLKKAGVV